jgi:fumarate reductase subunit C
MRKGREVYELLPHPIPIIIIIIIIILPHTITNKNTFFLTHPTAITS